MPTITDWLAIALSAIALLISARAAHSASVTARESTALQKRLLALEEEREAKRVAASTRAYVTAYLLGGGSDAKVCMRNDGSASASTVSLFLDGIALRVHPQRVGKVSDPVSLAPGAEFNYPLSRTIGSPSHFRARVTWIDPSGDPGSWESDISFL